MHARAFSDMCGGQAAFLLCVFPYRLVIQYCCAIDNRLLTTQYKTRPDGKKKKVMEKTMGKNIIIFACIGSGGGGLIFCWMNMEPAMIIGKMK